MACQCNLNNIITPRMTKSHPWGFEYFFENVLFVMMHSFQHLADVELCINQASYLY